MKKLLLCLIILVLAFTGCTNKEQPEDGVGEIVEEALDEKLEPNVAVSVTDLRDFFFFETEETLGTPVYNGIISRVRGDNYVIKPLLSGIDVSVMPENARIIVIPADENNTFSKIVYYYTDAKYNVEITVYYLSEKNFAIAKEGGVTALEEMEENSYQKTQYGDYNIVNDFAHDVSYAERILFDTYLIKVTGASFRVAEYTKTIDTTVLDMLSFEKLPITLD